jgi:hypothetical protein
MMELQTGGGPPITETGRQSLDLQSVQQLVNLVGHWEKGSGLGLTFSKSVSIQE